MNLTSPAVPSPAQTRSSRPTCAEHTSALGEPLTPSGVYSCEVLHHRFTPRKHAFSYRLFYLCLDLDELPRLDRRLRLFSVNRRNLFSFHERDYLVSTLPPHQSHAETVLSLKQRVLSVCRQLGVQLGADARVQLVTLPRMAGYLFNPVSFYFCSSRDGSVRASLAEVTNTFGEVKVYLVPPADSVTEFRARTPKYFYVSPFSSADLDFEFRLREPSASLQLNVDVHSQDTHVLHSHINGTRASLADLRLAWYTLKYPLATLLVTARIHWQALLLWAKRVPYFRKNDQSSDQRDFHRPSLVHRASS
ncbi:MAG TPA: DUF1365 domain-containing protein [Opitutaceae bacterium]|nr:DUF1365 domain-containing protein [Opitutaceae bacterium]